MAQLNGLLNIDLLHGYVPQLGDTFDIMNFANKSGTFSLVMGLPINGQEHFTLEYNPTNLTLDVVAGALLSPDSGKEGLPATVPFIVETDNDGTTLIASNIASGSAPHYGLSPTTPEPGSFLLLGSGLLCLGYMIVCLPFLLQRILTLDVRSVRVPAFSFPSSVVDTCSPERGSLNFGGTTITRGASAPSIGLISGRVSGLPPSVTSPLTTTNTLHNLSVRII
jgi:hypothetical protein